MAAIKMIEVVPSRRIGNVEITSPYSRQAIYEGTIEQVVAYLVSHFHLTVNAANDLVRKGREIRGIWKGVGLIARFDTQPI
jgi:hypothetical protein